MQASESVALSQFEESFKAEAKKPCDHQTCNNNTDGCQFVLQWHQYMNRLLANAKKDTEHNALQKKALAKVKEEALVQETKLQSIQQFGFSSSQIAQANLVLE